MELNNCVVFKVLLVAALFSGGVVLLEGQTAVAPELGDGSENNPYQISSLENLYWIAAGNEVVPNPDQLTRWSTHYIQTADIDASETVNWFEGEGWIPIGVDWDDIHYGFRGHYAGQNHNISELFINRPDSDYIGLFGLVVQATIENLSLIDVDLTGYIVVGSLAGDLLDSVVSNCYSSGRVSGAGAVGGLIGYSNYNSVIDYCHSSSTVSNNLTDGDISNVGGLVGNNDYFSIISNSYTTGEVIGYSWNTGGLVGTNRNNSSIIDSYSISNVNNVSTERVYNVGGLVGQNWILSTISKSSSYGTVDGDYSWNVGGLVGLNSSESSVFNCFSNGNVGGDKNLGGLVGYNYDNSLIFQSYSTGSIMGNGFIGGLLGINHHSSIENCFSTGMVSGDVNIGGLVGKQSSATISNSYWNTETSGLTTSDGGEGRATTEMTHPYAANTYVDWDFDEVWAADVDHSINNGYPYLLEQPVTVEEELIAVIEPAKIYNYPNPFNPETTIKFSISKDTQAQLVVYNIKGQLVKTLYNGFVKTGEYHLIWNGKDDRGKDVGSGVYFYRLQTDRHDQMSKMLLLK